MATRKVLGQVNPLATTLTDLYTVPASTQTVVSTVTVAELNGDTGVTFRLSVAVAAAADDPKQYVNKGGDCAAGDTVDFTMGMTLGPGDVVRGWASTAHVAFNVFGEETPFP